MCLSVRPFFYTPHYCSTVSFSLSLLHYFIPSNCHLFSSQILQSTLSVFFICLHLLNAPIQCKTFVFLRSFCHRTLQIACSYLQASYSTRIIDEFSLIVKCPFCCNGMRHTHTHREEMIERMSEECRENRILNCSLIFYRTCEASTKNLNLYGPKMAMAMCATDNDMYK